MLFALTPEERITLTKLTVGKRVVLWNRHVSTDYNENQFIHTWTEILSKVEIVESNYIYVDFGDHAIGYPLAVVECIEVDNKLYNLKGEEIPL